MPQAVADKISEVLDKPRTVSADGLSVTQHSIPDLIALEKHRANQAASGSRRLGIRIGRFLPPAHTGEA
jgi:hypothetical protein